MSSLRNNESDLGKEKHKETHVFYFGTVLRLFFIPPWGNGLTKCKTLKTAKASIQVGFYSQMHQGSLNFFNETIPKVEDGSFKTKPLFTQSTLLKQLLK